MVGRILEGLFGCWHKKFSFPMTMRPGPHRNRAGFLTGTYVVCLDCGKEFPYDWNEMKVISTRSEERQYTRSLVTKQAA
jgi:hypothetical protein